MNADKNGTYIHLPKTLPLLSLLPTLPPSPILPQNILFQAKLVIIWLIWKIAERLFAACDFQSLLWPKAKRQEDYKEIMS